MREQRQERRLVEGGGWLRRQVRLLLLRDGEIGDEGKVQGCAREKRAQCGN